MRSLSVCSGRSALGSRRDTNAVGLVVLYAVDRLVSVCLHADPADLRIVGTLAYIVEDVFKICTAPIGCVAVRRVLLRMRPAWYAVAVSAPTAVRDIFTAEEEGICQMMFFAWHTHLRIGADASAVEAATLARARAAFPFDQTRETRLRAELPQMEARLRIAAVKYAVGQHPDDVRQVAVAAVDRLLELANTLNQVTPRQDLDEVDRLDGDRLSRYRQVDALTASLPCANPHCGSPGSRRRNRKCGGCERVRYCSKACQLARWRVHRHFCSAGSV